MTKDIKDSQTLPTDEGSTAPEDTAPKSPVTDTDNPVQPTEIVTPADITTATQTEPTTDANAKVEAQSTEQRAEQDAESAIDDTPMASDTPPASPLTTPDTMTTASPSDAETMVGASSPYEPASTGTTPLNFARGSGPLDGYTSAPQSSETPEASETQEGASSATSEQAPLVMGFAAKAFAHMSSLAPIYLFLLFALHTIASIWFPSVYFAIEMAHLDVYEKMQQSGQWLVPPTTDVLGATLPGYYWFMALVDLIPMPESIYLPVLSSLTAFIALFGLYTLSLRTKLGHNTAFAAGLILLSSPIYLIFMHMVGPELLTAGLFCFALGLLFRGWTEEVAPFSFIFGFFFLALATLTGGFIPLWTVLIASVLLILWRGTITRAHQLDAVVGFGVLVLCFALWLVLTILGSTHATALDAIMLQGIAPFLPPYWPLPIPMALLFLAVGILPWILIPVFASWFSVLGNALTHVKASRKENSGPIWLYLITIIGLALIYLEKNESVFTALPAAVPFVPVIAVILAKTLCNFSRVGSNLFFLLLGVVLLLCGVAITTISVPSAAPFWTPYIPENITNILLGIKGLPILSGLFIITALLLVRFTKRAFPQGALMVVTLFSVLMVQPMILFVAPSFVGHMAQLNSSGAGLGTLPPSIAPNMPVHPIDKIPVAPIEGEDNTQPTEPTPVIRAPEPTTAPTDTKTGDTPEVTSDTKPEVKPTPLSAPARSAKPIPVAPVPSNEPPLTEPKASPNSEPASQETPKAEAL